MITGDDAKSETYETTSQPHEGRTFFTIEETRSISTATGKKYVRPVVRHPGGAAVVPVYGRTALCVEQYRPAVGCSVIEIPGGRPYLGESPLDTARRELHEETGLVCNQYDLLARCWAAPDFSDWQAHLYLGRGLQMAVRVPSDEIPTCLRAVPLSEVESLVAQGILVDAKTIVGLLLARAFLNQ